VPEIENHSQRLVFHVETRRNPEPEGTSKPKEDRNRRNTDEIENHSQLRMRAFLTPPLHYKRGGGLAMQPNTAETL
jgi:hypothetical protein